MKRNIPALFLLICLVACSPATEKAGSSYAPEGVKTLPDGTRYLVHPDMLISGGPPMDGIPSIDNPRFASIDEADAWLEDEELGAAVVHGETRRFYPLQILVWHEIVNENVSGTPVLVTYCPLCGSVIGFERTVGAETLEFGTSGKLFNSNLVMYDRSTGTYWTQIGGRAIIGEFAGLELSLFPVDVVEWGDWKRKYPDSEVLSRSTGHVRPYGSDPYGDYYSSGETIFPAGPSDGRLHPKAVVFGVVANGTAKAYPEAALRENGDFEDQIGGVPVSVRRDAGGFVTVTDLSSGIRIPHERDFWFAWFAFHPHTELYAPDTSDGI